MFKRFLIPEMFLTISSKKSLADGIVDVRVQIILKLQSSNSWKLKPELLRPTVIEALGIASVHTTITGQRQDLSCQRQHLSCQTIKLHASLGSNKATCRHGRAN